MASFQGNFMKNMMPLPQQQQQQGNMMMLPQQPSQPQDPGAPLSASASAAERAHRSVFVGNIPYDATEEQLKDVFVQAGPVVSFRLVYDRETGKPKGYGFCEYQDVETAQSAMRNLNNFDFNGRPLRVGVAAGEQSKDDGKSMQQALGGQVLESPYGEAVEPEKAPEAITKAVASLPPEQMFELMKQMKLCIQNNPNEARNMLLQNPQLAYALLQAQIVMKIVDPQVAMSMLYRDDSQPQVNMNTLNNAPKPQPPVMVPRPNQMQIPQGGGMGHPMAPGMPSMPSVPMPPRPDMRMLNRPMQPQGDNMEARRFPGSGNMGGPSPMGPTQGNMGGPPTSMGGPQTSMGGPPNPMGGPQSNMAGPPKSMSGPVPPPNAPGQRVPTSAQGPGPSGGSGGNISAQDQEKAALIMQVLQLTDEQIALLPEEQRRSILILKEQIKSG